MDDMEANGFGTEVVGVHCPDSDCDASEAACGAYAVSAGTSCCCC
jgi:hypothetical protein